MSERFEVEHGKVVDIYAMIPPINCNSTYHAMLIRDLLNKNWGQFNEQKCIIKRLELQNKKLHKINGELHRRLGDCE